MTQMILVYVTCTEEQQAKLIGKALIEKKLCACFTIIPSCYSAFFWPPKSGTVEETTESILQVKTLESKWSEVELEIKKLHSDKTPCIYALPISHVTNDFYVWLKNEVE